MEPILDFVQRNLEASRGSWPSICKTLNLDYSWLQKLAQGRIPDPGVRKVERLAHYFRSIGRN